MSPASSQRTSGKARISEQQLLELAEALANGFLSGRIGSETAALVRALFPGATLVSISVLAGGRLLITEHNLVEPGYVKVCFDRVHQTVAGQAVVRNNIYFASLDKDRAGAALDLERASLGRGCQNMVSAPISQRHRRASLDMASSIQLEANSHHTRRNSTSSRPASAKAAWRDVALGSLTVGTPADVWLSSTHIKHLSDLAESLAPMIQRTCGEICSGLESLFCQREPGAEEPSDQRNELGHEESWSNAQFVEDYVDALLCRWCAAKALGPCQQATGGQETLTCSHPIAVEAVPAASTC